MHIDEFGVSNFKATPFPVFKIAPDVTVSLKITEWQVLPINRVHIDLSLVCFKEESTGKIRHFIDPLKECKKKSCEVFTKKWIKDFLIRFSGVFLSNKKLN